MLIAACCVCAYRWHGIDVETANPNSTVFQPNPSVYARGSNRPEAVQGMFQVGVTNPPRLAWTRSSEVIFSKMHRPQSSPAIYEEETPPLAHSKTEL